MYLGIDLGTSGVKLLLLDAQHRTVATADAALGLQQPQPLWSEQDPAAWWSAFEQAFAARDATERQLRQFLADASHELRTPLAVLKGELEALEDGVHQPTPELLEEDCGTLRRAQHKHRIDLGDVESFVEHVDREQTADITASQGSQTFVTLITGCLAHDQLGGDLHGVELFRHETSVFDRRAEPERAHLRDGGYFVMKCSPDETRAKTTRLSRVRLGQRSRVVGPFLGIPFDAGQVGVVANAEIVERDKEVSV